MKSLSCGCLLAVLGLAMTVRAASPDELQRFIARIKSEQGSQRVEAIKEAGAMGAAAVPSLAEVADGEAREPAIAARTALKHLAAHAGRPGSSEERQAVATALTGLLSTNHQKVLRCLALDLISLTGGDAEVPQVATLLADPDEDVADEARRCLQGLPGQMATKALLDALPNSQGRARIAFIHALGCRGARVAAGPLAKLTESEDMEVALAALEAIGRLGAPRNQFTIRVPDDSRLTEAQRMQSAKAALLWAESRAAQNDPQDAMRVYARYFQDTNSHLVCASLIGMARVAPERAAFAAAASLTNRAADIRLTAARLMEEMPPNSEVTTNLLETYKTAGPEGRETILRVLKAWNDKGPRP